MSLENLIWPAVTLASLPSFDPVAWLSFMITGFGLLIHLTLVNIVLGLSVIVPLTEYIGYKTKDADMERLAKRLFRYLALSDLVAGVFGTWVAVVLTAFFPGLIYIFSTVLFFPTMVALIGIFMAIPSIAIYWYGWDKMSKRKHLAVGAVMGIGALLVPVGFRMYFTFVMNSSSFDISSLSGLHGSIDTNLVGMFSNPIYITLLVHSWFGGLTMAALFAAGAFGWSFNRERGRLGYGRTSTMPGMLASAVTGSKESLSLRSVLDFTFVSRRLRFVSSKTAEAMQHGEPNPTEIGREVKYVRFLTKMGLLLLIIQSAIGVVYFVVLSRFSPYVFAAITGNTSIAAYNFSIVFIPFMFFVALIWVGTIALYAKVRSSTSPDIPKFASILLMVASFLALPLGEASNDASKAPYMIMLSGTNGIPANVVANSQIPVTWPIAALAVTFAIIAISVFLITVYFIFVKKMEPPEAMR